MKTQKSENRWWGTWALAGMVAATSLSLSACIDNAPKEATGNTLKRFQLTPAASCDAVEDQIVDALVEQALNERYNNYNRGWEDDFGSGQNNVAEPSAPVAGGNDNSPEAAPDDFTTTNVQEEGVDEADFVKTDGTHVYTLRGSELIVMKSWPADETEIVGRLSLPQGYASSMFLKGDRIALFSNVYSYGCQTNNFDEGNNAPDIDPWGGECSGPAEDFNGTRITVVDISNRTAPTILRNMDIESSYNNARMIGSDVYLVSNSYTQMPEGYWNLIYGEENTLALPVIDWDSTDEEVETARTNARPILRQAIAALIASEGVQSLLPKKRLVDAAGAVSSSTDLYKCTDVYLPAQPTQLGMLNVTHFKIDDDSSSITSTGLLAGGTTVYSSQENLYVALSSRAWFWGWGDADNSSHVHKFALDGPNNKARYAASGEVDGWLLNQFSMSEYEGHLRLATTDNEWVWNELGGVDLGGNHVIILKEDQGTLVETGSIRNLAPDERVYSARFLGDKGYVVTFRETDPLFTFDLSNPNNPQLLGELKINGFSSYIHPMGPNHLLTIGQDATDEGVVLGVHLQIFDVSDMENPTRTYQHLLSTGPWSSWSEAMWDHRAFTYHAGKEILAIPFNSWDYENGDEPFSGLVVLKASNTTGFEEIGRVDHSDLTGCVDCDPHGYHWWVDIRRSIFMDDFLFSISDLGVKVNGLADPDIEHASVNF